MKIDNHLQEENHIGKPTIEIVQKQKQEYKLIEQYVRSKGLRLYAYNHMKDEITEIKPQVKTDIEIGFDKDGKLSTKEQAKEEVMVDARNTFFESLNMENAIKRVNKYKSGKIKELCNLRKKSDIKPILPW